MKSVTVQEFYQNAGLVERLGEGKQLVVTSNGKPKFLVRKSSHAKMTRELAEKRSIGNPADPSFDGVGFLSSLKN